MLKIGLKFNFETKSPFLGKSWCKHGLSPLSSPFLCACFRFVALGAVFSIVKFNFVLNCFFIVKFRFLSNCFLQSTMSCCFVSV